MGKLDIPKFINFLLRSRNEHAPYSISRLYDIIWRQFGRQDMAIFVIGPCTSGTQPFIRAQKAQKFHMLIGNGLYKGLCLLMHIWITLLNMHPTELAGIRTDSQKHSVV